MAKEFLVAHQDEKRRMNTIDTNMFQSYYCNVLSLISTN